MFLSLFFYSFLTLFCCTQFSFFSLSYFTPVSFLFGGSSFLFSFDQVFFYFLAMVGLVTCLVSCYSEFYMESYNNSKFLALMILFFVSMLVLSLSGSLLLLLLGWDGLGLSSICLIMFYPNKTTLFNSVMTMFFNRLGDVFLIFSASVFFFSPSVSYIFSPSNLFFLYLVLMLCSFTKSAQFPLSAWLPAAMSAPTPISAMVHSSTLVTAGVYLVSKFYNYFWEHGLLPFLLFFSVLSFLGGGLMANLEQDLKKVVAFSTMSQISMIMVFCSLSFYGVALLHMFFHATFKTLLFCSCGAYFMLMLSDQKKSIFSNKFSSIFLPGLFLFSIFSMSGLSFSSSYASKDVLLEVSWLSYPSFSLYLLLAGSVLTLFYCGVIYSCTSSWFNFVKSQLIKTQYFSFFLLFSLACFFSGYLFKSFFFQEFVPLFGGYDLFLLLFIFFLPLYGIFPGGGLFFLRFSSEVSFMKFGSYGAISFLFGKTFLVHLTGSGDHFFFKPSFFPLFSFQNTLSLFKFSGFILVSVLCLC